MAVGAVVVLEVVVVGATVVLAGDSAVVVECEGEVPVVATEPLPMVVVMGPDST